MISHDDVTKQIPAVPDDGLLEPIDQPESIRVIAKRSSGAHCPASSRDKCAGLVAVFVAFQRLKVRKPPVKRKTKNQG